MIEHYPALEPYFAQVQLVCFMLALGTTLAIRDFVTVVRRPRSFLVAIGVQLLVLPWLAVLLDALFPLPEGIAVGLVLVAAMPGGALSKLFSYLGQGNAALSIALTAFTTLATLVTVPVLLELLVAHYHLAMPVGAVLLDLGLFLLLPLLAGMGVGRRWPAHRAAVARWCVRVGLVVVALMVVGSLGSGRIQPGSYGWSVPVAITLFCLLGQQLSMVPFYLGRWPRADRLAVGIEVTMRNMNLALLLKARLFPEADALGNGVLFVILFYAAAALGAGLPLALNHRRLARRVPRAASARLAASASPRGNSQRFTSAPLSRMLGTDHRGPQQREPCLIGTIRAMKKQLVVLAGPDEGRVFALGTEVLLLGRSRATDSHLLDPHVSRVHCQIVPEQSQHFVVDFESAGGTFVNGKQVNRHELKPGDLVRIGTTHLQYVEDQEEPAPVATPAAPRARAKTQVTRVTKVERPGAWADALVGQVFSHYKVGRPLARGHTGFVFHAADTRRNLPLALKVLDTRYCKDEQLVKKFVEAMKTVMPLRHPNLIRVYSAGRTADHLWVAMELVKAGESLAAVIGRSTHAGRADWRVVVRLGTYLARALDYAHQKKIVHQNVAPQNIILARQLPQTKLADLMLANALSADPTEPISAAGTPSESLPYLSPERTDGAKAVVDSRTDIYSLGATLYALVTGHAPFHAETAQELIEQIRLNAAPTLPAVHVEAPAELDVLLRRCLAKRPQDRFESAKLLLKDLEHLAKTHNIPL